LARRSRPGSLQASSDSSPVSERPRMHHRVCRSTASRSPVLTCAGICVPPTVIYLPYRVSGSTLTAVGRSRLLARWPGTHSRLLSGIQRAAQTVLGVYLKRTRSRVTSASSALGFLTIMRYTNPRTHSLVLKRAVSLGRLASAAAPCVVAVDRRGTHLPAHGLTTSARDQCYTPVQ